MDDDNERLANKSKWRAVMTEGAEAISDDDWSKCAPAGHPLVSHALFMAMEASGSAARESGWLPRHLTVSDQRGVLRGIMPFYVKSHSYGEYVFDHGWAGAWQQTHGGYYPKAQTAVPFTPVPGPRLLIDQTLDETSAAAVFEALAEASLSATYTLELSSIHITFLSKEQHDRLTSSPSSPTLSSPPSPWISRINSQFHWYNENYRDFDAFLDALTSRKRKTLRRERRVVAEAGVTFEHLTGAGLKSHHWDRFYEFYLATVDKKWSGAYLTRDFFAQIHETMADEILLIIAYHDGVAVAGALNFIGDETLYGRNWGCLTDVPFLHFETCYYQAIDFAIRLGLKTVEAGAQGLHKVQRGYIPVVTYSAHHLADKGFHEAVRDFTSNEAAQIEEEIKVLNGWTPYREKNA